MIGRTPRTSRVRTSRRGALRSVAALLVASTWLVGCGGSDDDATPACVPSLRLGLTEDAARSGRTTDAVAVPHGVLVVAVGEHFNTRCQPTAGSTGGSPMTGVRLYVVQGAEGSQRVSVAQVNAGADDTFVVSFGVPDTVAPGSALLVAQLSEDAKATALATATLVVS